MSKHFVASIGLALLLFASAFSRPSPALSQAIPPGEVSAEHWAAPAPLVSRPTANTAAVAVGVGQPGLSFRYVQAFGSAKQAYISDTAHLNYPYGLATDGNSVWIAESNGDRALKFSNTGQFLAQIGQAGAIDYYPRSLRRLVDAGVDGSGNIWLVDMDGAHVVKFDSAYNYVSDIGQLWNQGSDSTHFAYPAGIAFDASGNIYISDGAPDWNVDLGNQRVQIYNSSGVYLHTIGITGTSSSDNAHLYGPRHIGIYGNTLYVADSGNHRVQIYDVSNPLVPAYLATIGTGTAGSANNQFNNPSGVTADASSIYVADTWNNRVQIFNRSTRAYVATVGGSWGSGNNQFKDPSDVAVDASGNLYVADYNNTRVQQFNASHNLARTYGVTGVPYLTDGAHLNQPKGVAIGPDGAIYTVEERGQRLVAFNPDGTPRWTDGTAGVAGMDNNLDMAHLNGPTDVAVNAAGHAYVADTWNHRIAIFNSDGTPYSVIGNSGSGPLQFNCPRGLTIAPTGAFYVADTCNHRVQIFSSKWVYSATLGVTGISGIDNAHFNSPEDVAVDSKGTIYVADTANQRIQVFNANRTYSRTLGIPGASGSDFAHFNNPARLAVDNQDNLYVADGWNNRIQVFDSNGAYLTSIGGAGSGSDGQPRGTFGIAIDRDGSIYASGFWDDYRVHKFVRGVPGWQQMNINGFGDRYATWIGALQPFQGQLYAGGAAAQTSQVWRMMTDGTWSASNADGFGDAGNREIDAMAVFSGSLYATTYNWTCDDPNCDTGHNNGPQVWRTATGTAWEDVTPPALIGGHNWLLYTLAEFNGYLYAGTYADNAHGAEVWRTANGTDWTRVVENGFDNDLYNTSVLSLMAFNGNLYASTRHGDWISDSHTDGPLGAEVWRTSDGLNWTRVNTPGFGDASRYRIETMQVFQNQLYAYVWGGSGGAQVWRCAGPVCDSNADWAQVVGNGFGVPGNTYLYAGAVYGNYLYAAAANTGGTGNQLWRSSDGQQWEKAAPYDGLGNSRNYNVPSNAMTVFDERLYISLTNDDSGAGIWKKTVSAGFAVNESLIKPGTTVTFTNTSAGDYITSTWQFGDGSPAVVQSTPLVTHAYAHVGAYTVTLTVDDGVDTNARTGFIQVGYRSYMPVMQNNASTLIALYDNFNDIAFDGFYSPLKWVAYPDDQVTVKQSNGALVFTNTANAPGHWFELNLIQPPQRTLKQLQRVELRMKVSSDHHGGWDNTEMLINSNDIAGHGWWTMCGMVGQGPQFGCEITTYSGGVYTQEYSTAWVPTSYNAWYTAKIEIDPNTALLRFYLNGTLIGSHTAADATALVNAKNFVPKLVVYTSDPNTYGTRYVDDVKITPAW